MDTLTAMRMAREEERAELLAERAEPVATLHDDGCFTWKRDEFRRRYDKQRAGWRMDVYASPPARPVTDERLRELMPKAHSTVDGKLGVRCSFESAEARKGDSIYTADQMLAFARAVLEESRK